MHKGVHGNDRSDASAPLSIHHWQECSTRPLMGDSLGVFVRAAPSLSPPPFLHGNALPAIQRVATEVPSVDRQIRAPVLPACFVCASVLLPCGLFLPLTPVSTHSVGILCRDACRFPSNHATVIGCADKPHRGSETSRRRAKQAAKKPSA